MRRVRPTLRVMKSLPETPAILEVLSAIARAKSLASADEWWTGVTRPCVLTPHAGEFARLRAGSGHDPDGDGDLNGDDEARVRAASAAATEWNQVVVLKGAHTVIAAPGGSAVMAPFENPAMASGGTGDVLAGTIGALGEPELVIDERAHDRISSGLMAASLPVPR